MEVGKEIAKAIAAVMIEVEGIEKSMKVGDGNYSYQGVPDQEVKKIIGASMKKNGLCIVPISVDAKTEVSRWEYKYKDTTSQKQQIFTEVSTKYLLIHTSGQTLEISGYGHGVDSQDKSAGKATTYALKYALLYTFLVPTGNIDDSDTKHSKVMNVPPSKELIEKDSPKWLEVVDYLENQGGLLQTVLNSKKYKFSEENIELLKAQYG